MLLNEISWLHSKIQKLEGMSGIFWCYMGSVESLKGVVGHLFAPFRSLSYSHEIDERLSLLLEQYISRSS